MFRALGFYGVGTGFKLEGSFKDIYMYVGR